MAAPVAADDWRFEEVAAAIGASWNHGLVHGPIDVRDFVTGGLAAADIDGDQWVDLYVTRGDAAAGLLLRNLGDGRFVDVAADWQLLIGAGDNESAYASGAAFVDVDGDGRPDLLLTGIRGFGLRYFHNDGERFSEQTSAIGLAGDSSDQYSLSAADIDGDQRLDLAVGHWDNSQPSGGDAQLWWNQGGLLLRAAAAWGVSAAFAQGDYSFTPNFADLDGDRRPDLLISADFGTSQVFLNAAGQAFDNITSAVISDQNGMGAAVGDIDNDGDPDWFVSAIWDAKPPPGALWGSSGNRLYRNDGLGGFSDITDAAGVRQGDWAWGACMADFDLDGYQDIFQVNGWNPVQSPFQADPARLFINQRNAGFAEQAESRGIADRGQGRGIVCFDYDRDGDIDVFINNNQGIGRVYRSDASSTLGRHWIGIRLHGRSPNSAAIGARVQLRAGDLWQTREIAIANHYLSTSPAELLFGLDGHTSIDRLSIDWPNAQTSHYFNIATDRWLTLTQPDPDIVHADGFDNPP